MCYIEGLIGTPTQAARPGGERGAKLLLQLATESCGSLVIDCRACYKAKKSTFTSPIIIYHGLEHHTHVQNIRK